MESKTNQQAEKQAKLQQRLQGMHKLRFQVGELQLSFKEHLKLINEDPFTLIEQVVETIPPLGFRILNSRGELVDYFEYSGNGHDYQSLKHGNVCNIFDLLLMSHSRSVYSPEYAYELHKSCLELKHSNDKEEEVEMENFTEDLFILDLATGDQGFVKAGSKLPSSLLTTCIGATDKKELDQITNEKKAVTLLDSILDKLKKH